jgi:hypothetical protein
VSYVLLAAQCNGQSANNTINTCNGNDCAGFIEGNGQNGRVTIDQPAMWTENEVRAHIRTQRRHNLR